MLEAWPPWTSMQGMDPAKQDPASSCPGEHLLFLIPVLGPQLGLQTASCHPGFGGSLPSGLSTTLHLGSAPPRNSWAWQGRRAAASLHVPEPVGK